MIEARLLQYFLAVAQEQSITRAANYLHITQPTLSKQMMELEQSLGKQLLVRGKRKVTLTEDGVYLQSQAREIISLMEKTEASFRDSRQAVSGDVYIGCGELHSLMPVIRLMKEITDEYPDIRFHFFSGNADAITERLDKGILDMGFLLEPQINPKYDYLKLPFNESFGILAPKDSPIASKKSITLNELQDLPLILPSQTYNSSRMTEIFALELANLKVVATYNLIYNASLMVEAGMGYALCIDELINTGDDHPLKFIPLSPTLKSDVYLFTKKYQVVSRATKIFLDRVQEKFKI